MSIGVGQGQVLHLGGGGGVVVKTGMQSALRSLDRSTPNCQDMVVTIVLCVLILTLCLSLIVTKFKVNHKLLESDTLRKPPGPKPWPILGDLHLLGKYPNPFVGFTHLSKVYGDIYQLTLGTTKSVIVNSFPLIKEVLITKGQYFGGRPDFIRFHKLFGGDRNNCKYLH